MKWAPPRPPTPLFPPIVSDSSASHLHLEPSLTHDKESANQPSLHYHYQSAPVLGLQIDREESFSDPSSPCAIRRSHLLLTSDRYETTNNNTVIELSRRQRQQIFQALTSAPSTGCSSETHHHSRPRPKSLGPEEIFATASSSKKTSSLRDRNLACQDHTIYSSRDSEKEASFCEGQPAKLSEKVLQPTHMIIEPWLIS